MIDDDENAVPKSEILGFITTWWRGWRYRLVVFKDKPRKGRSKRNHSDRA